jgi:hypothetical protein
LAREDKPELALGLLDRFAVQHGISTGELERAKCEVALCSLKAGAQAGRISREAIYVVGLLTRRDGDGEVKALVVTANQRRGVAKELYVHSNDPISPVVHLAVTGYVRPAQLVFSPRTINLGCPRRTETMSAEIYVPSFEEDKIEVTSVSSDSPHLSAELSPTIA